jgi:hypothetical protein
VIDVIGSRFLCPCISILKATRGHCANSDNIIMLIIFITITVCHRGGNTRPDILLLLVNYSWQE